jgi:hypothetical protein
VAPLKQWARLNLATIRTSWQVAIWKTNQTLTSIPFVTAEMLHRRVEIEKQDFKEELKIQD